jgi:hypothetical protein
LNRSVAARAGSDPETANDLDTIFLRTTVIGCPPLLHPQPVQRGQNPCDANGQVKERKERTC